MAISVINNNNSTRNHPTGVNFLLANASQEVTALIDFVVDFDFVSDASNVVQFIALNKIQLLSGQSWNNLGFKVGDIISFTGQISNGSPNIPLLAVIRTISDINGSVLTTSSDIDSDTNLVNQLMPFNAGTSAESNSVLNIVNTSSYSPQTLEIFHNIIENSQPQTINSLLDSEVNRFVLDGVDAMVVTDIKTLTQLGNKSGGTYTSATLERLANVVGKACYRAEFKYFIPYQFEDTDFNEPTVITSPLSLKNFYQFIGLPQTNNPNAQLTAKWSSQLGNTGWYNENYNQGINEFTVDSFVITDNSANILQAIDPNQENNIVATISGAANFLETAEIEFYLIPDIATVKNKPQTHAELIYLSNSFIDATPTITNKFFGIGGAEMEMDNQVLDVSVANKITISFKLRPTVAFNSIAEGTLYRIAANVESTGGTVNDNNAVSLILNEGELTKAPIEGGVYPYVTFQGFFNHSQDTSGTPETVFNGCTEDDMLWVSRFNIKKIETYKKLTLNVQIVKDSTGQFFNLFERLINFQNFVTNLDNVIQINYSENLPQYLESTDRNKISVKLTGNDTIAQYEVEILWSMMADWRYWIAQSNGSMVDFFNGTLPNNGQSAEWMRYLRESGYSIRLKATLTDDIDTNYHWATFIDLQDYDDTAEITTVHEYYDSSDVLQTALLESQTMRIKAIHTLTSGSWDTGNLWGWISTRPKEAEPNKRISTVWDWTSQNLPLKPLTTETKAKLTFPSASVAVVECLIDTTYINVENTTVISRIETPSAPLCTSPIDWLFDQMIAMSPSELEYAKTLRVILALRPNVAEYNVCCPSCEHTVDTDTFYIWAFGKKTKIDGLISTYGAPCCKNELGGAGDCDLDFNTIYADLEAACTGSSLGGEIPTEINSFFNNDLQRISDRIIACTTDQVIRYNILEVFVQVGVQVICNNQTGTKIISAL